MKKYVLCMLSVLVLFTMLLAACSSDSSSTSPTPIDVTGDWDIGADGWGLMVWHLTQNGQNVSGTVDRAVAGGGNDNGRITSGSNVSNRVTLEILFDDGMTATFSGNVQDANNMSGTYTDSQGDSAAWTATRTQ